MEDFPALPVCVASSARMRRARATAVALIVMLVLAMPFNHARADEGPATGLDPALERQVRTLALAASTSAPSGVTRVEVVIGQLDPRLHLAPCQRVEPYLPNGVRLWGKARIGLRCTQGPTAWNVFIPITVKAFGRALVATTFAPSGSVLKAGDLTSDEVDLAEDPSAAVVEPGLAVGRMLAQSLTPGQSLRQSYLKPRIWFAAGDTVKLVALGEGFSLESEGQALSNGIEGQTARVRIEGGRVLTGQPVGDKRVELSL